MYSLCSLQTRMHIHPTGLRRTQIPRILTHSSRTGIRVVHRRVHHRAWIVFGNIAHLSRDPAAKGIVLTDVDGLERMIERPRPGVEKRRTEHKSWVATVYRENFPIGKDYISKPVNDWVEIWVIGVWRRAGEQIGYLALDPVWEVEVVVVEVANILSTRDLAGNVSLFSYSADLVELFVRI